MKNVEEEGSRVLDPERIRVSSGSVPAQRDRPMGDICFSKIGFLAFIAQEVGGSLIGEDGLMLMAGAWFSCV